MCDQNIIEFFNGFDFVLALNNKNEVFSWGKNTLGQLGRGYRNGVLECLKPEKIFFKNKIIVKISCGYYHSLALSSDGVVYGWGGNSHGEIGFGNGEDILLPIELNLRYFNLCQIKAIYCLYNQSFVLTTNGLVYSWGWNSNNQLGHEIERNESILLPKLIDIHNIKTVCSSLDRTYFLTTDGFIFFCGKININSDVYQKMPIKLETTTLMNDLFSDKSDINIAIDNKGVIHYLDGNKINKTKFRNIFAYFVKERQITYKTYYINESSKIDLKYLNVYKNKFHEITSKQLVKNINGKNSREDWIIVFENLGHENLGELGEGSFGKVYKFNLKKNIIAIKSINTKGLNLNFEKFIFEDSIKIFFIQIGVISQLRTLEQKYKQWKKLEVILLSIM